jgi:hypothetical protein
MEKISSIVSSKSPAKVDMSKERPVRAGAPSYGQPISSASHTFDKMKKEEELMNPMASTEKISNPEVARHMGIVDKITLSFKGNSEKEEPIEKVIDVDSLQDSSNEGGLKETQEQQPQSIDVYA